MRASALFAGAVCLRLAAPFPAHAGEPQRVPPSSSRVAQLLSWLPADTETVIVTQTPARPRTGPLFDVMRLGELSFGNTKTADAAKNLLRGFSVEITVEGSRHFLPPSGLGEMRYEGATLFVLNKPLGPQAEALMAVLKRAADGVLSVEGVDVLQTRETFENDVWTFYTAIAGSDAVIVATDRAYLSEVLRRRAARGGLRALPANLTEWRWVDVTAPYWAVRHYRRDRPNEDPTSTFVRDGAAGVFDDGAIGVAAYATADGRTAVVRYLTRSPDGEAIAARMWKHPDDGVDPVIRTLENGVIEARFTARDADHLKTFFFYLFAALGHAIYV